MIKDAEFLRTFKQKVPKRLSERSTGNIKIMYWSDTALGENIKEKLFVQSWQLDFL